VSLYELVNDLVADTLGTSLGAFLPELVLCATIVVILLVRIVPLGRGPHAFWPMLAGSLVALYFVVPWDYLRASVGLPAGSAGGTPIFTGMLVYDLFSVYMRGLLLFFAVLFALFTRLSGVPERDDANDFYVLVLGATLGMCLMVSANHVLMIFLGIEMASVPMYVLAGLLRERRKGSEASLKFAVFGAATAGVMLYGISLLVGALGSAHLPTMARQLAEILQARQSAEMLGSGSGGQRDLVLVLGGLMLMVGLAFKLSAVPFHFWAPDVFEGAAAEVGAFLSVASKAAALGLLARLAATFGYVAEVGQVANLPHVVGQVGNLPHLAAALEPAREFMAGLIMLLAAVTCTFGNLAAYGQTNIKRLLAYSTIAHAGYMMMPVAAAVVLMGHSKAKAAAALGSMALYIAVYLFMNLGAFAVAAFLRNKLGSEEIADYAGLVRRWPGVAVCFAIILFSLVGLPPLAGFSAKFAIFSSVFEADLLGLLFIGVLNTVLSLFYYVRIVKIMMLDEERPGRPAAAVPLVSGHGVYCAAVTLPLVVLFVWWGGLFELARTAAGMLF
jgi:NADH-quinone oxidoreductase subunit N